MSLSGRQMLDALSRVSFIHSAELVLIIGAMHTTFHRALAGLLADGIVGRVSQGTATCLDQNLPPESSQFSMPRLT